MVKEQIVGVGEQMVWGQACSAAVRHPLLLLLAAAAAVCAHISALLAALCVSSFDAQPKLTPHRTSANFTQTCLSLRPPICAEAGGSWGVYTAGPGSLLLSGGPHALCSLGPHGAVLIWWDILFVWDSALCGVSAVNNSCKVCSTSQRLQMVFMEDKMLLFFRGSGLRASLDTEITFSN